jgi:L-threonylcarbamoyladenylate synthase
VTEPDDSTADVRHSESETAEPDPIEEVVPAAVGDVDPGYQLFDCAHGDSETIAAAVEAAGLAIERGECVVLPTDTVYGIGADAFSPAAVQRLLDAKVRGRDMPPPVLIGEPSLIRALAVEIPQQAKDLVAKHWPGPLTVICRMQPSLRMDLGDTEGTIALRVPDHALARRILRRTGPIAVSSANISGLPPATSCDQAVEQLAEAVAVYLDAGPLGGANAMPSTIVDFTERAAGVILRHGALSVDAIKQTLPDVVDVAELDDSGAGG